MPITVPAAHSKSSERSRRNFFALKLILALALAALPPIAASGGEVSHWPNAILKGYAKEPAPKVDADRLALERLRGFGNHYVLVVHRLATGPAESREAETGFYVVQAGEATMHTSGEIVDAKTTAPGEVRGSAIKGGRTMTLKAGGTVNIPPMAPHHVAIEAGKSATSMIVKVKN